MAKAKEINNFRVVRYLADVTEVEEVRRFSEEAEASQFAKEESRHNPDFFYEVQRNTYFDLHESETDDDWELIIIYKKGLVVVR